MTKEAHKASIVKVMTQVKPLPFGLGLLNVLRSGLAALTVLAALDTKQLETKKIA